MKLTPSTRRLLERVAGQDGRLLELQITASGGSAQLNVAKLIAAGLIESVDHPTVVDRRSGTPARALRLTEQGRAALA